MTKNNEVIEVTNPATGEVVDTVLKGGKKEAVEAVDKAYQAFQTGRSNLSMKEVLC